MNKTMGGAAATAACGLLLLLLWYDSYFRPIAEQLSPHVFKLILVAATVVWLISFRQSLRSGAYWCAVGFVAGGVILWATGVGPHSLAYSIAFTGVVLAVSYLLLKRADAEMDEDSGGLLTNVERMKIINMSMDEDEYEDEDYEDDQLPPHRR